MYFLEVGAVLTVAPWTTFWDRNYFVESFPLLETILTSYVVRGAVTGVGLLSWGAAFVDVSTAMRRLLSAWLALTPSDDSIVANANPRFWTM